MNMNNQNQLMESVDDMEQSQMILINKILKFIVSNKVNQMITFMLNQYQEGLSKEVLDMIRETIKNDFERKIQSLLQSAFEVDQNQWFENLGIAQPNEEQANFQNQVFMSIDEIFNEAQLDDNADDSVFIEEQYLENLARLLLSNKELRAEFANQVRDLTQEAKNGLETEYSDIDLIDQYNQRR